MTNEVVNVPELRFSEFKGAWKKKKLSDLGYYSKSYPYSRAIEGEGIIHHIHYGDIHSKLPSKINDINLLPTIVENRNFEFVKKGDIIFADASEDYKDLGKAVLVNIEDNNIIASLHTHVFRLNKEISAEFLMNFTKTLNYYKFIKKQGTGISVLGISKKNLSNLTLNIPKYNEQQKIGIFFSKLDQQIELEEQKLAKLEEQKKGYMQKIFSQEIRFKDDNGNSYPEWESAPLFDIFSATKGKSLSKDKISNDGKYECILYGEIYTTYAEKIESIVSRTNYYEGILSQKNDLIFPNSTTTNAWDLATFSSLQKNNVLIGGDISILRTKRSDISSLFYAYYLTNYLKLRKDIAKYAQGITIVHLSFNNFCKIKVQIPSLEEQNSITDFIDSLNQQQKLITNKIKLLKERKKGFLQKMFV